MKIYTSYFYQIRFMNPNIIPMSTAVWDPKWYHDNKGKSYVYKDKNGTYIGLKADPFVPDESCDGLCYGPETCSSGDPSKCDFLRVYRKQLDSLDFDEVMSGLYNLAHFIKDQENLDIFPDIALIFHEAPNNPCSERWAVQSWFRDHGYGITEFNKD